ncbi:tRNA-splicing endonuclease subunit Sen15-like [Mya arenaria]|uniref:tRNA-splicing endonuclease subunit Sen15-like n=1 Tax=Mya arenaria TaxID=6604 RepID=UPI0022E57850|nr:tRNA-splicing endonuclease subunit Sen15-like [Mya arenaria]
MSKTEFSEHPVYKEIAGFGFTTDSKTLQAFKIYMDLCEAKGWWNVKCHACSELSRVFVSGHANRNTPRELVLPVGVEETLSHDVIQSFLKTVRLEGYSTESLTLGLCSGDGSAVYYRLTDGLLPPEPPDVTEWRKYRREEKGNLQRYHQGEQTKQYIAFQQHQQQEQQQQLKEQLTDT